MVTTKRLLKNNRFIVTNNGGKLIKNYNDGRIEGISVGYLTTLANNLTSNQSFDINYNYYINECNKIIKDKIEFKEIAKYKKVSKKNTDNTNQLTLF
jgi:hypothetical protein